MANEESNQEQESKELIPEKKKQLLADLSKRTEKRTLKPEDISVINIQLSLPASMLTRQVGGVRDIVIKDKDGSDGVRLRDWDSSDYITKLDRDPNDIMRWEDKDETDAGVA